MSCKEDSDYVTGVYRSKDPIKCFKIRVKLQQDKSTWIPMPHFHAGDTGKADIQQQCTQEGTDMEEQTFAWQQKVFSCFEAAYYSSSGNCHTPLEEKYHSDVTKLYKDGPPNNRLFSYTQLDNYSDTMQDECVTTGAKAKTTWLVDGMKSAVRRQHMFPRPDSTTVRREFVDSHDNIISYHMSSDLKKRNHFLQTATQAMYIIADLSDRNSGNNKDWSGHSEYVLCKIQYNSLQGILTVTPDFSTTTVDGVLLPYHIEVDGDARNTYKYWIEHASEDMPPKAKEQEQQIQNKMLEHKVNVRQVQVGIEFLIPRSGYLQTHLLGQIVSAANFEYDELFIHYMIHLPSGWSSPHDSKLMGTTVTCNTRGTGRAHLSHIFEVQLLYNLELLESNQDILPSWPQLFLEVVSSDSWKRFRTEGYGYLDLPSTPGSHHITVNTWRPVPKGHMGEMRRFFIGDYPLLNNITYTRMPADITGPRLSKYGLDTVTSGTVHLELHIMHQSQGLLCNSGAEAGDTNTRRQSAFFLERLSAATLVNSVDAVMAAFQRARKRMLNAKENLKM